MSYKKKFVKVIAGNPNYIGKYGKIIRESSHSVTIELTDGEKLCIAHYEVQKLHAMPKE